MSQCAQGMRATNHCSGVVSPTHTSPSWLFISHLAIHAHKSALQIIQRGMTVPADTSPSTTIACRRAASSTALLQPDTLCNSNRTASFCCAALQLSQWWQHTRRQLPAIDTAGVQACCVGAILQAPFCIMPEEDMLGPWPGCGPCLAALLGLLKAIPAAQGNTSMFKAKGEHSMTRDRQTDMCV